MLDFAPTDEQKEIQDLAHSLAVEQLRVQGRAAEKRGDIAPELMQTLAQTGLTTPFSEEFGGSGMLEAVTYVLIAEELGFGDGGLATNVLGSLMGPLTVLLAGDAQQQEQYIPRFCDERKGYLQRGSLAFAERMGGYTLTDVQATVQHQGENYVLNGTKRDVLHGEQSDPRVVIARLEGTSGIEGLCALMVPTDVAGVRESKDALKIGLFTAPSASYLCENVQVAGTCMLGKAGDSGVIRATSLHNIL